MLGKLTACSEIDFAAFTVNQGALRHCIDVFKNQCFDNISFK